MARDKCGYEVRMKDDKNTAIYIAYEEGEPYDTALPEKNLLRAILLTAMADLKKPGEPSRRAVEYFLSADEEYIFSFNSVCNYLDLDPDKILVVTGLRRSCFEPMHVNGKCHAAEDVKAEEQLQAQLFAIK